MAGASEPTVPCPHLADHHAPGARLLDHLIHQFGLHAEVAWNPPLPVGQVIVVLHRLQDGVARAFRGEVSDAQVVGEQIGDERLEAIQPRDGIVAQREHEVGGQSGTIGGGRKLRGEIVGRAAGR